MQNATYILSEMREHKKYHLDSATFTPAADLTTSAQEPTPANLSGFVSSVPIRFDATDDRTPASRRHSRSTASRELQYFFLDMYEQESLKHKGKGFDTQKGRRCICYCASREESIGADPRGGD